MDTAIGSESEAEAEMLLLRPIRGLSSFGCSNERYCSRRGRTDADTYMPEIEEGGGANEAVVALKKLRLWAEVKLAERDHRRSVQAEGKRSDH